MGIDMLISIILYVIMEIISLGISVWLWTRDTKSPANIAFFAANICLFFFTTMSSILLFATDKQLIATLSTLRWGAFLYVHIFLAYFILLITETVSPKKSSSILSVMIILPLMVIIISSDTATKATKQMIDSTYYISDDVFNFSLIDGENFLSSTNIFLIIIYLFIILVIFNFYKKNKTTIYNYKNFPVLSLAFLLYLVADITLLALETVSRSSYIKYFSFTFLILNLAVLYCSFSNEFLLSQNQILIYNAFNILKEGLILTGDDENIIYINAYAKNILRIKNPIMGNYTLKNIIENLTDTPYHQLDISGNKHTTINDKYGNSYSVKLGNLYDNYSHVYIKIFTFREINKIKELEDSLAEKSAMLQQRVSEKNLQLMDINEDLRTQIIQLRNINKELYKKTFFDKLTGLPNRRKVTTIVNEALSKGAKLCMIYFDISNFKRINDNFSYSYGDNILRSIGDRIFSCLPRNTLVSRIEADEFIIVMPSDKNKIVQAVHNLKNTFDKPFDMEGFAVFLDYNIGISLSTKDINSFEKLLRSSNIALNNAYINNVKAQIYSSKYEEEIKEKARTVKSIQKAIQERQFILYFQPQVNSQTGRMNGCEALIRWNHPEKGILSPGYFIPFAEKENLITDIDKVVLETACDSIKYFESIKNYSPLPISVNLSVKHLESSDIIGLIKDNLTRTGINPAHLKIEFTESFSPENISNPEMILNVITDSLGVKLSIDDFGVDYSSFDYIKRMNASYLKIDISFVRGIGDTQDDSIICSIINLAKRLDMISIAEGVETKEQADFLAENNCDLIQGYYYYKPMSIDDLEKVI